MRWRWEVPGGARWLVVRYGYKEWGNMECFGNPIVVFGYVICNIIYCIVESLSLIRGRRHGWPNHVKTSCTICVIVLSLCYWTNIIGIKVFVGITSIIQTKLMFLIIQLHITEMKSFLLSPIIKTSSSLL